ncbi:homocysteine S-methyltransferase family protein [Sporichthya polymorpha]|uniref:homocysteine S-methyltransferase family protein n=1 Tax=Sporichthya polymorpha TaxID=35751 RepID=UPI000368FDF5|nr:homocysteine S-methyltransferase family protein [Sporichthya polymorpha]
MLQWVTDGGLETDLLFHHGVDLPEFAAFPLVEDSNGRKLLTDYFVRYVAIAAAAGAGLVLETPTWRANPDWAAKVGYDAAALDRVNQAAVELVRRTPADVPLRVSGSVGPRGDGYVAAGTEADEAAEYHAPQLNAFAAAGADVVHAMTMTGPGEAIGIVRAARAAGLPVGISFTVETDGRLPDGTPLSAAIASVDAAEAPDWYGVNCAHPTHVSPGLDGGDWQQRITVFRPNASTLTHAELDAMEVLDEGDRPLLRSSTEALLANLPSVTTLGGCCGTDSSHVALLWGVRSA